MLLSEVLQHKHAPKALTLLLLVVSAVFAMYDIEAGMNIVTYAAALFTGDPKVLASLSMLATMFLGIAALAFVVFSFEYHLRNVGKPGSRRLFTISLSTLLALFLVGYLGLGVLLR